MLTQFEDIQRGFERDIEGKDQYVVDLIEQAERRLRRRLGPLDVWANTPDRVDDVKDVVRSMIHRVLRNDGSIDKAESDGDYSYTRDPLAASANLWVTDDEWDQLVGSKGTAGAGTIRVGLPSWSPRNSWG